MDGEEGWQPIVSFKTVARLVKAAWCLLLIAAPCEVLRRLTVVAGHPAASGEEGGSDVHAWHTARVDNIARAVEDRAMYITGLVETWK